LVHAKRFEVLSQFAGGVAHEIRNPLNSIGMTAQYLKNIFSQKELNQQDLNEVTELLDIMNYETEQLKKISEQFLTLNRPRQLKLEAVSLNRLLDFVLVEFKVITDNSRIKILRNYDSELPQTQLDNEQIRQFFFNLIQNAIQAIQSKNGSIYITTNIEQNVGQNWIIASIRDTGVGIPHQIQERIFEAYFTTKEREGGIGLGLAIAYQIIMAHGGKIEVKSQVGMGTEFKVFFKC
jgi:signal transduction histidine kinase